MNILITGAFHLDGLADTCDGIYSSRKREKILEIYLLVNWKLIAQMPFGKSTAQPDEKKFQPLEERIMVFK